MESLTPPKTIKIYQLVKQSGLVFTTTGSGSGTSLGVGFSYTLQEAEHNRTLEVLKDTTTGTKPRFHVFEIEVPNPAYQE